MRVRKLIATLGVAAMLAVGLTAAPAMTATPGPGVDTAQAGTTYYPATCQHWWTEYWGGFYSPVLGKYIPRQVWAVHYKWRAWWEPNWLEYLQGKRSGYITVKTTSDYTYPYTCRW